MLFTQKISYIVQHNLLYVNFLRGGLNFLCNTAPPLSFSPASLLLQFSSGRFELPLQYRPSAVIFTGIPFASVFLGEV